MLPEAGQLRVGPGSANTQQYGGARSGASGVLGTGRPQAEAHLTVPLELGRRMCRVNLRSVAGLSSSAHQASLVEYQSVSFPFTRAPYVILALRLFQLFFSSLCLSCVCELSTNTRSRTLPQTGSRQHAAEAASDIANSL